MLFSRIRKRMKGVIIFVAVAFGGSLLYGATLWRARDAGPAPAGTSTTAAVVNGEKVESGDFDQVYRNVIRYFETVQGSIGAADIEDIKFQALSSLIDGRVVVQMAEKEDIKVTRKEINEKLAEIREGYPSPQAFKEELEQNGVSEADLRSQIRDSLAVEKLRDKLKASIAVPEDEIKKAYEKVRVSHVLVSPKSQEEAAWKTAEAKARDILASAQKGLPFETLAKTQSDDESSKDKGGDLGFVGRGETPPEFEALAFGLKAGAVGGPVKSTAGYHVLKVIERQEAQGPEYTRSKKEISDGIAEEKANEKLGELFKEAKSKASISITDPALQAHYYLDAGDLEKAVTFYEKATREDPEDAYARFSLGKVYLQMKQPDKALPLFEKAAELSATDPEIQLSLGSVYQEKGMKEKAISVFSRASELAPSDFLVHLRLISAFKELGANKEMALEQEKLRQIQKAMEEQQRTQEELQRQAQESQQGP